MKKRFADLHCHPHSRSFHWLRGTRHEKKYGKRFHAWNVVVSNFKRQEKGKRAFSYSQCDPVKLWNGETKLVFASLYPFEKGFYMGGTVERSKVVRLLDVISTTGLGFVNPMKWGQALFALFTGAPTLFKSSRAFLQSLLMRMPIRRVKYFTSSKYDYYDELLVERDFLFKKSGIQTTNQIFIPGIKRLFKSKRRLRRNYPDSLNADGKFVICKNFDEVEKTINDDDIAMILTIEGLHALGTDTAPQKAEERILEMKKWPQPVFFITIAHHFNNYLLGHAHSIPNSLRILSDQEEGMNESFSPPGERVIKLMLGLDDNLERDQALGHRILPDLKHTAVQSRKWYYDNIIDPCAAKGDVIPIIMSHVGYSGWKTLQESIDYSAHENDDDLKDGFYPWNINACGEDVVKVAKSGGLIGLCFDQRILGDKKDKRNSIDLIFNNLMAMIDAIVESDELSAQQKEKCWTYFTIGTDFEGYIDPTQDYSNSLELDDFGKDLMSKISLLSPQKKAGYYLNNDEDVKKAVEGICFDNPYEFLRKNFQFQE
ncbi:MAG: hypothetical protein RIM99_00985 [Cyclobacteriaceae bacterium]